jgi:hypothetical protein
MRCCGQPVGLPSRSSKSEGWWSQAESNRRPLACHASALPIELWPLSREGADGAVYAARVNKAPIRTIQAGNGAKNREESDLVLAFGAPAEHIGDIAFFFFLFEECVLGILAYVDLVVAKVRNLFRIALVLGIGVLKRHEFW